MIFLIIFLSYAISAVLVLGYVYTDVELGEASIKERATE